MEHHNTQKLAEKIALILREENSNGEISTLRASIEKIGERLSVIEEKLQNPAFVPPASFSINLQNSHPSQEKFPELEMLADEIINQTEKACPYEPTGKPCDNCAMCNSRGF